MNCYGIETLKRAEWLLGFDFDGTLADIHDQHSVSEEFFHTLHLFQKEKKNAWGICTGRSLDYTLEGILNASFPALPDFLITQERDIFFHAGQGVYLPDQERNQQALCALESTLSQNTSTLNKIQHYVERETNGEWVSLPNDPAGIIASQEEEIQQALEIYHACSEKTPELNFQRNTIYLRFTHRDYCKGTAVKHLRNQYNIPWENTLVMGDNYNDLTMLNAEVAQHFGAPANALPSLKCQLKETGGFITENPCAQGVAEALKYFLSH